jgi:hypothetical protein
MPNDEKAAWPQPRPFCEGRFRREALEKFDRDPNGDRDYFLDLLGQFLDVENPKKFKTIPELRKAIQQDKRVFPSNAGSYRKLIPIVRGVLLHGINFFPKKVRKKRAGKRKAKISYEEILERWLKAESISRIADVAGISRTRVRQIVKSESLARDNSKRIE